MTTDPEFCKSWRELYDIHAHRLKWIHYLLAGVFAVQVIDLGMYIFELTTYWQ
jgi:hypothetical protein